jgi:Amt family ammonium transporter
MAQCVGIACLASVLWLLGGYSLSFSGTHPLIGDLAKFALNAVPRDALAGTIPENVFFSFQMAFAIITPALIIGATVERMKFSAVMLFSGLWLLVVYAPVCHWVWGGGWLMGRFVMDYAGGLVVHATAGVSALLLAWKLGPRDGYPRDLHPPHNPGMTMMGAGLLWVGWYGFNAGSALAAEGLAANAFMTTTFAAATACIVWALIEKLHKGKPSILGFCSGAVAGLVVITPAAGFVDAKAAMIIGVLAAVVPYFAVVFAKSKLGYDDALDTFGIHGVGGTMGALVTGIFANNSINGNLTTYKSF